VMMFPRGTGAAQEQVNSEHDAPSYHRVYKPRRLNKKSNNTCTKPVPITNLNNPQIVIQTPIQIPVQSSINAQVGNIVPNLQLIESLQQDIQHYKLIIQQLNAQLEQVKLMNTNQTQNRSIEQLQCELFNQKTQNTALHNELEWCNARILSLQEALELEKKKVNSLEAQLRDESELPSLDSLELEQLEQLHAKYTRMQQAVFSAINQKVQNITLCDICYENQKNTLLDPCGHVFCSACIARHQGNTCPKCRTVYRKTQIVYM
jgi:predicted  nucleic acid-binding Zn-ribbon protein